LRWHGRAALGEVPDSLRARHLIKREIFAIEEPFLRVVDSFKRAAAGSDAGRRSLLLLGPSACMESKPKNLGCNMKSLRLAGLLLAVLSVVVYVVVALRHGKPPDLPSAIIVFIGIFSLIGATRLVAFALTDQLEKMASKTSDDTPWKLSPEDSALIVIGGITLGWVSIQAIVESFIKIAG
jgi:hypothetical protein